ncbi:hypothetical protein JOC25_000715 [Solibacillus kalamii]|uniref:Uncharacterized protein n=3 Tax=Solibacillus TaxID=648800 RepID=F2F7W4_SOLSS|nr:hypothetical protein B857_00912 [Solibacillus isronensis B3W22]MBM7664259.1 hypothetical protein [Solibacillus kalamii]OUZ39980.1 hypothetical protein CBM15_05570 [Solibacillus kalamii]BAK16057.1 hypothetical protein SSIL_1634 [Solibacillus silvestris StLB046]
MEQSEKEISYCHCLQNEKGALFLLAVFLLFIVSGAAVFYTNAYFAQIKVYNSLESIYVRATINILNLP